MTIEFIKILTGNFHGKPGKSGKWFENLVPSWLVINPFQEKCRVFRFFRKNFRNFPTFPENFPVKKSSKFCRIKFPINWHLYFLSENGENLQKNSRKIHVKRFSGVFPTKEAFKTFATWDKLVKRNELHKVAFVENSMEYPEKRKNHRNNFHRYD